MAVKPTILPGQIGPDGEATTLTSGINRGLTEINIVLEVAVTGDAQIAFDVNTTETISPLFSDEFV